VIADANFPAETCATRIERLPGISATQALSAILTIMPLDTYVDAPARSMQVVGSPNEIPDIVKEFQTIINKTADNPSLIQGIERHEFYVEANNTYCIIQTSETRFYGNIILSKGVVSLS
jgi:L-fucose mutarotase